MNEYKLTFTEEDMHILQRALVELPFKIAAPFIDKINYQIKNNENSNTNPTEIML